MVTNRRERAASLLDIGGLTGICRINHSSVPPGPPDEKLLIERALLTNPAL